MTSFFYLPSEFFVSFLNHLMVDKLYCIERDQISWLEKYVEGRNDSPYLSSNCLGNAKKISFSLGNFVINVNKFRRKFHFLCSENSSLPFKISVQVVDVCVYSVSWLLKKNNRNK